MKHLILILLLFVSKSLISFSQTVIYKGNKKYPATNIWIFRVNGAVWDNTIEVSIGKDGNTGILMLKTGVTPESYIGGPVYVFLSDGTRLTCSDKGIKDNVDNQSIALYKFSADEIEILKTFYITSIRFTLKPTDGGFNGNKTAENEKEVFTLFGDKDQKNYYLTSEEVSQLFQ